MKRILLSLICVFAMITAVFADSSVIIKDVSATEDSPSASDANDNDNASGWGPGESAAITFQFKNSLYLTNIKISCSGGNSKAVLRTSDNIKSDINLKNGLKSIKLPSVLTRNFTIELVSPPSKFKINEVSFLQGQPLIPVKSKLTARASSILQNKRKRYGPQNAIDGNLATAWNEGVKNEKGQWLEIKLARPSFIHHAGYIVGYSKYNQKVGEVWFKNYRIKSARIDYGNGWYYNAEFEDRLDYQYVPVRMKVKKIRLTIMDLYDTLKWKDTPISEVKLIYEHIEDIKLEAGFDQDYVLKDDKKSRYFVVRVKGAYTPQAKRMPVNIGLVVDQSGSMNEQNRMLHAKEAAKLIVSSLGPDDYMSLITFDTKVYVKQQPTRMDSNTKNQIIREIDKLKTLNMTNFYGALNKSLELTKQNESDKYSNRILMLSDGKPTTGIRTPSKIAAIAQNGYENNNILTSTFGVGAEYNEDLMTDIAVKSNGSYYHVTNPAQMFKYFIAELSSILKILGNKPRVELQLPDNLTVKNIYGYKYLQSGNQVTIPIKPISSGDEQKIVIELSPKDNYPKETQIDVSLTYEDVLNANNKVKSYVSQILERTDDPSIARSSRNNVAVAEILSTTSSQGLEDAANTYKSGSADKAKQMMANHIKELEKENKYLQSKALEREIAVLKSILGEMQANSYRSSSGKLTVKEAKAAAFRGKIRSYDDQSLSTYGNNVNNEMRRLLASNFSNTDSVYGNLSSKEIVDLLVRRGLTKQKAARMNNTMGFRAYKRKEWDNAISWFDNALKYDPNHVLAIYNAACTWGLKGSPENAVKYLDKLAKIKNNTAKKRVRKTKKDSDFDLIRNSSEFKDFLKRNNL